MQIGSGVYISLQLDWHNYILRRNKQQNIIEWIKMEAKLILTPGPIAYGLDAEIIFLYFQTSLTLMNSIGLQHRGWG